jgi:hypothetical protein
MFISGALRAQPKVELQAAVSQLRCSAAAARERRSSRLQTGAILQSTNRIWITDEVIGRARMVREESSARLS